jgi:hypothetical protein
MLEICKLSPAENKEVFTVIVVALAEFITIRLPASLATSTALAVFVTTGMLKVELSSDAVKTLAATKG